MNILEVVSLIANIILIIVGVGLTIANWKADKRSKSQVKIWMEQANGVHISLNRIVIDKWNGLYSNINDVVNAVWVVQASAFSLYQSLYEERVLTEKMYIKEQLEQREFIKKQLRKTVTQKKTSEAINKEVTTNTN